MKIKIPPDKLKLPEGPKEPFPEWHVAYINAADALIVESFQQESKALAFIEDIIRDGFEYSCFFGYRRKVEPVTQITGYSFKEYRNDQE